MTNSLSKGITILGATGSIGLNTLDVIAAHPDKFHVVALSGHRQLDKLFELSIKFSPKFVSVLDEEAAVQLRTRFKEASLSIEVLSGVEGLCQISRLDEVWAVMAAIVGSAGLVPALAAAQAGKRVMLANKESLVVAGNLFMQTIAKSGAELLPVDSEHNAIFQALPANFQHDWTAAGIDSIILTASGGPFRQMPLAQLYDVSPEMACKHPNWSMGQKISVDSASLMNKGLEVIEAHWLFNAPADKIEVVVHPQSVIHSMVRYVDGSVIAQLGSPDMRTPISYALAYPERIEASVARLDFMQNNQLSFEAPDLERFRCLALAFESLKVGQDASLVLNGANEVAVEAFLQKRIGFMQIPQLVEDALAHCDLSLSSTIEEILEKDAYVRQYTKTRIV